MPEWFKWVAVAGLVALVAWAAWPSASPPRGDRGATLVSRDSMPREPHAALQPRSLERVSAPSPAQPDVPPPIPSMDVAAPALDDSPAVAAPPSDAASQPAPESPIDVGRPSAEPDTSGAPPDQGSEPEPEPEEPEPAVIAVVAIALEVGDECGRHVDGGCASTALCVGPNPDEGTCIELCRLDEDDDCADGGTCTMVDLRDEEYEGYGLCHRVADCDVVAQTGCPEDAACVPTRTVSGWTKVCQAQGEAEPGATCDADRQCPPGYGCWSINKGVRRCLLYCQLPSQCPDEQSCFDAKVTINELGICP